jgi:hypothetical protein
MNRKKLLKHLVVLMFFIFITDLLARHFYWYFSIWYFDMIMHFLSGLWVGLFFLWFFHRQDLSEGADLGLERGSAIALIVKTLLFVIMIGGSWEVFEFFVNNHIGREAFNARDTISDIFFDLAGGAIAVLYFLRMIMSRKKNKVQLN